MKRLGRKLRIKMRLKVYKNGKMLYDATKQKKAVIFDNIRLLQTQSPDKWCICVSYGKARTVEGNIEEICNAGEYDTSQELIFAMSIFTEKPLLDDIEKWIAESK